jgi:hypothetical protein
MVPAVPPSDKLDVPATLQLTQVGHAPRNVVQVGQVYEQTFTQVAACSPATDLAVVVHSLRGEGGGASQIWVVRLSTGRILWTRQYQSGTSTNVDIHSSIDGRYIAETTMALGGQVSRPVTTIYSPAGAVLGRVNGEVQAFSWDGSLAVVANYDEPVSIVRWRDGTTIWSSPATAKFAGAQPEPGGSRSAVSVDGRPYPEWTGFLPVDVDVVSPDGTAVRLLTDVMTQY